MEETTNQPESIPPFPSPSTFTFLPDIYDIISRLSVLRAAQQASSSSTGVDSGNVTSNGHGHGAGGAAGNANGNVGGINPLTTTVSHESRESRGSRHSDSGSISSVKYGELGSGATIELKDLQAHAYAVKQAIQRAKDAVRTLPDMNRTTGDQEQEIASLEGRIEALKGRLVVLKDIAREEGGQGNGMTGEDVVMDG